MLTITIDTREQCPLDFSPWPDVVVESEALYVGDYAPRGLGHLVAVERKSLPDLVGSLTSGRDRFAHEMERARGLALAVVIEGTLEQVRRHDYRSKAKPHAILQSMVSWSIRYGVHWIWAGDAAGAAYYVVSWMRQWLRIKDEEYKHIKKHASWGEK